MYYHRRFMKGPVVCGLPISPDLHPKKYSLLMSDDLWHGVEESVASKISTAKYHRSGNK